jgi:hypothetical protein
MWFALVYARLNLAITEMSAMTVVDEWTALLLILSA